MPHGRCGGLAAPRVIVSAMARQESRARPSPLRGILGKAGALHAHDAEALTRGRLHDDPAFQSIDDLCAERFEPGHLGGNIVRFNVNVDAAVVAHALYLHDGFVVGCLEHAVVAARAGMIRVHRPAERLGPEPGRLVDVGRTAIDQHRA
jgi:hypothetical protein